jgi:hypothetical protein
MRIEYKIVETSDTGVPLKGEGTYNQRLQAGLDELGREGWLFQVLVGSSKMIFARKWRRNSKERLESARLAQKR